MLEDIIGAVPNIKKRKFRKYHKLEKNALTQKYSIAEKIINIIHI